jgi:alpha-1,2-mannosyltransferase
VVLLAIAAAWVFTHKASNRMPDFEVYWKAGSRATAGEPLYRESDADYQFKYFPAFAVMAIPIAAIPMPIAKAIWFTSAIVSLVMLLRLAPRVLPERRRATRWLVCVAIVALGKYYARDLVLGQINTMFALVVTAAIVAMTAGREALAGVLVACGVILKPYALIFLPWIVARRKRPSIVTSSTGVAVVLLLPVIRYGIAGTLALYKGWWTTVSSTTADTMVLTDNISIAAMYVKWLGPGAPAWPAILTSMALLLCVALVFLARRGVARPDGLEGALLLMITPLVSPQGWDYVMVVSTAAIVFLANYFDRLPRWLQPLTFLALAAIGLTLFDLLGRVWLYRLLNLSIITLGFFVVVAALATLRARRVA